MCFFQFLAIFLPLGPPQTPLEGGGTPPHGGTSRFFGQPAKFSIGFPTRIRGSPGGTPGKSEKITQKSILDGVSR